MNPQRTPPTFDPYNVPLSGWNLLEASAGTGKTYALAGLYVRLLIEKGLSTREILVVTFTKAATDELKGRIRARIKDALGAFAYGPGADEFLAGLVSRTEDHERARRFLTDALRSFDESAIFTIHGFCLRALHNHAFESGSLFDTELLEDETDMMKEMIRDFWRINFYQGSGQLFSCIRAWVDPEELLKLVRLCGRNPFLRVRRGDRADEEAVPDAVEQVCLCAFFEAAGSWRASRQEVRDILAEDPGLNRSVYNQKAVERIIEKLDAYFSSGYFLPVPDALDYFCFDPPVKPAALKKQAQPPVHPFFSQCEVLRKRLAETSSCYDEKLAQVREELIDFIKRESSERKLDTNVRTFSDLLLDLHDALQREGGEELAASLRKQYKAALIDEFQDTDLVQYAIFRRIYDYEGATLFLIGDPKQAIFGFRGADLFAYIKASGDVAQRFTLDRNWRSSESLIKAVNAIFDRAEGPFLLEPLKYLPVSGSGAASLELTIDGRSDPSPFKLWFLARRPDGKPLTKGFAREVLYRAVSSEIGRLLKLGHQNEAFLGDRPVTAGDIAVIVRINREAREMQSTLRQVNIPSVVYTGETVFKSDEALELEQIFQAVIDPTDEGKVKVALITRMMGVSGDDLARIIEDETEWDRWLTRFDEYRMLWLRAGFISMARTLVSREQVKRRLGAFSDGERRLTNLLHLLELLHRAFTEEKLGMEGLLKWLGERRQLAGDVAPEEHQIRLETDEMAVKIVTIHKSKGLEYPITFCPFLWGDSRVTQSVLTYHDKEESYQSIINVSMNPDETAREYAETEQLAENIRLTYVALTRAKCRCYAAWGYINNSETSALAYLLHGRSLGRCDLAALESHIMSASDEALRSELASVVQRSQGAIEILPVPEESASHYFIARSAHELLQLKPFAGEIELDWRVSSFSALTSGKDELADLPDRDRGLGEESSHVEAVKRANGAQGLSIFTFPAGPKAGSCLHEILEHLDFARFESDETRTLVAERLGRYGFASDWVETICLLVKNVLIAPLDERGLLTLSALGAADRLHEVEFHVPLSLITPKGLGALFGSGEGDANVSVGTLIKRLGFKPVKGMLKGYIDLVFQRDGRYYIVDWKSNYLGASLEDYTRERLSIVMEREFYTLQYHIYAVALHRFLELRLPDYQYDAHFGGVYYLFLRGMGPAGGYGVLFDRPAPERLKALAHYLTGR
ncbi:MAG TPA: exodeoxyribonuclease V subunit beta [Syntrophorhabdales bacterium]|nr:exodeoxyribonuclease V subunit beta [Syntrophorhabdales bacterium]